MIINLNVCLGRLHEQISFVTNLFYLQDKKLSVDEVMDNHELFIGSQATDFGNYLNRHDEF